MANLIFQHLWFPGTTFFCNGELVLALGFGLVGLLGFFVFSFSVFTNYLFWRKEGEQWSRETDNTLYTVPPLLPE